MTNTSTFVGVLRRLAVMVPVYTSLCPLPRCAPRRLPRAGQSPMSIGTCSVSRSHINLLPLVFSILGLLVCHCSCFAQAVSKQGTPTVRSQTNLVEIPVVVMRGSRHVQGLNAADFTVLEDGVKQHITHFNAVSASDTTLWKSPDPRLYTNTLWDEQTPARVTVLVFDLLNTPFAKQSFLRDALVRFLGALPNRHDPLMLVAFTEDGLKIIHFFTADTAALRNAISKIKAHTSEVERATELASSKAEATDAAISAIAARNGGHVDADDPEVQRLKELFQTIPDSQTQARDLNRTTFTLVMMQQLARSLYGIPGRKSMIWATGGISYIQGSEAPSDLHPGQHKSEGLSQSRLAMSNDMFEQTWQLLSDANVAVYIVDMEELKNPGYTDASYATSQVASLRVQGFGLRSQAMNGFTDKTGGGYCPLREELENCFSEAMADSSQYYILGYYPKDTKSLGWRKVKVKVAGRGTRVHTRTGYFFRATEEDAEVHSSEVARVLVSPLDATGIRLTFRWVDFGGREATQSSKRWFEIVVDPTDISIDPESSNHFRFSVTVAARNKEGQYTGQLAKTIEGDLAPTDLKRIHERGFLYRDSIVLSPGEVDVRVVVRDEIAGKIGSVTATL